MEERREVQEEEHENRNNQREEGEAEQQQCSVASGPSRLMRVRSANHSSEVRSKHWECLWACTKELDAYYTKS